MHRVSKGWMFGLSLGSPRGMSGACAPVFGGQAPPFGGGGGSFTGCAESKKCEFSLTVSVRGFGNVGAGTGATWSASQDAAGKDAGYLPCLAGCSTSASASVSCGSQTYMTGMIADSMGWIMTTWRLECSICLDVAIASGTIGEEPPIVY